MRIKYFKNKKYKPLNKMIEEALKNAPEPNINYTLEEIVKITGKPWVVKSPITKKKSVLIDFYNISRAKITFGRWQNAKDRS